MTDSATQCSTPDTAGQTGGGLLQLQDELAWMFVVSKAQDRLNPKGWSTGTLSVSVCECACMVCVLYLQLGTSKQKQKKTKPKKPHTRAELSSLHPESKSCFPLSPI